MKWAHDVLEEASLLSRRLRLCLSADSQRDHQGPDYRSSAPNWPAKTIAPWAARSLTRSSARDRRRQARLHSQHRQRRQQHRLLSRTAGGRRQPAEHADDFVQHRRRRDSATRRRPRWLATMRPAAISNRSTRRRIASLSQQFRAKFGPQRVVTDPMEAAYMGVKLWAAAVRGGGEPRYARRPPGDARRMRLPRRRGETAHRSDDATRVSRRRELAESRSDGQFEIVWTADEPVAPEPYPSERSAEEWRAVLHDLQTVVERPVGGAGRITRALTAVDVRAATCIPLQARRVKPRPPVDLMLY